MVKDLPKFRGDDPSEVLVNFFKDLGWDKRFVNKGPSSSESVPKGKVLLENGAFLL